MEMIKLFGLSLFLLLLGSLFALAQSSKKQNESLEQKIRRLDLAETEAILIKARHANIICE